MSWSCAIPLKAPLSFNTFENMLPEAMSDILELSVRAADSNSQAFIRLTGGCSAEVSLDIATESSGAVEWVEVWNEKVQANSTLFDGLHVRLAAPQQSVASVCKNHAQRLI